MKSWLAVVCLIGLVACSQTPQPFALPLAPEFGPASGPMAIPPSAGPEFVQAEFAPHAAEHFQLVDDALRFQEAELALLTDNGFVITDRLAWKRFQEAYAWIYWQDLPVLVTTDSILHTVHQSYSNLLQSLERDLIGPVLEELLARTAGSIEAARAQDQSSAVVQANEDLYVYLQVALALLRGEPGKGAEVERYVQLAMDATDVADVALFGTPRPVDFSLFKPRGHYALSSFHQNYFRAVSWLAHIDFRLVSFDEMTSEPEFHRQALLSAALLQDHLLATGQDKTWQQIDQILRILVGQSDNMTLADLERYRADLRLDGPQRILNAGQKQLLQQLLDHDYGQQRITGQILARHLQNPSPDAMPLPVSFMLIGQRFSLDAYAMSNLVYDRLLVEGDRVMRRFPSTMDVMYVLGNDRALSHLEPELAKYGYRDNLEGLRATADSLGPDYWQQPVYNQWLGILRTLNRQPQSEHLPLAMRTPAWADKVLHTQLASWAQLRHDNIAYAKQSFTMGGAACEYPAGYVEPYPEFYRAVYEYAQENYARLQRLDVTGQEGSLFRPALDYFSSVMAVMEQLQRLATKELAREPFTAEEERFLKGIVRRQIERENNGCTLVTREYWDGWYPSLFYSDEMYAPVVADVHTNQTRDPAHPLYPPGVLHVASGPVAPMVLIVNTGEDTSLYVGPAFTYFEFEETGYPFNRLDDEEWQARLGTSPYPAPPTWTAGFRVATPDLPRLLELPRDNRG